MGVVVFGWSKGLSLGHLYRLCSDLGERQAQPLSDPVGA
jgi:hypothetical protein